MATSNSKGDSTRTATVKTDSNKGTGASTTDAEAPVPTSPDERAGITPPAEADKRDGMTVEELQQEAKGRDLPSSGTRVELLARLRSADVEEQRVQAVKDNPFLNDKAGVDVDATLTYAERIRALVQEVEERIDAEITSPVTGVTTLVSDPAAGRMVASSRRLLTSVEDARRALRALSAAAASLGQDAVS